MKKLLVALLVLAIAAAAGLYWLSRSLDGLIQHAIESYGSPMTQSQVRVAAVKISPSNGRGSISGLTVANPPGFKTPHALKVTQADVEVDLKTVTQDVVLVRRIAIQAPDVTYEKGDTLTNFDAIVSHIAQSIESGSRSGETKPGKRMIIELLTVRDARVEVSAPFMQGRTVSLSLPDITLKDIGRATGGVTPAELGQVIAGALKSRLGATSSFDRLLKPGSAAIDQWVPSAKGLFK